MQKLADTRPVGIGSMGAGASGMRGRNPDAPAGDNHRESQHRPHATRIASALPSGSSSDGEEKVIADRLVEIFSSAPKT